MTKLKTFLVLPAMIYWSIPNPRSAETSVILGQTLHGGHRFILASVSLYSWICRPSLLVFKALVGRIHTCITREREEAGTEKVPGNCWLGLNSLSSAPIQTLLPILLPVGTEYSLSLRAATHRNGTCQLQHFNFSTPTSTTCFKNFHVVLALI